MTRKPYVFIGSSSEGKDIATAIKENLDNDADVVVWDQNAFELSRTYLESLEKQMHLADFAIVASQVPASASSFQSACIFFNFSIISQLYY